MRLARRFRELAGFQEEEMDTLAEIAKRGARGDGGPSRGQPRRGGQLGPLMPVEVRPDTFSMVFFDAAEIRAIVEKLVAEIGLPGDLSVTVEVDETTPMGRARRGVARPRRSSPPSRGPSRTSSGLGS